MQNIIVYYCNIYIIEQHNNLFEDMKFPKVSQHCTHCVGLLTTK